MEKTSVEWLALSGDIGRIGRGSILDLMFQPWKVECWIPVFRSTETAGCMKDRTDKLNRSESESESQAESECLEVESAESESTEPRGEK